MASTSAEAATAAVLQALHSLYHDPDPAGKRKANDWLQEFQHSVSLGLLGDVDGGQEPGWRGEQIGIGIDLGNGAAVVSALEECGGDEVDRDASGQGIGRRRSYVLLGAEGLIIQVEAWQTCHTLLTNPASPPEGRLFAAQTIRAKILYDLSQLPREQLPPLRDSIITSLSPLIAPGAPSGSRAVLTQLCLALADLALQMPEWTDVVGSMIDQFGKDPTTVNILLGFLKSLVEEVGNPRLNLAGMDDMISVAAERVIGVLTMYIQAPAAIQAAVFETLRSWLQGGEVMAARVASTPLFPALFEALPSDELFDSAVDCLCDLIHETQEVQENVDVIQNIVPRIVALRSQLEEHKEDPDRIRGYCRILCEAGETYKNLIVSHLDSLLPLVEAIAACAAYPDLDIVPITFNFWYELATALGPQHPDNQSTRPLLDIFSNLQSVIIGHLHFPADNEQQTASERDEFRMFRHRMGDTLKDCCHVLGASTCLRKSYELVQTAMAKGSPSWQEIEAPLFSMRSMGAKVNPDDDEILPHIMDMLPNLPEHPRIRYAAILVISRYTQWIDRHPQNLAFQLQYISLGFHMAEEEVSAAAAQAMKYMCQDCSQHLIPFLPQLHEFVATVGDKLDQADMMEVCEAIGYIVDGMPPDQAAPVLQQFCQPLLERIQVAASSPTPLVKPELQKVADALEQIDSFLNIVRTINPLPESCYPTALAVYQLLDALLAKYAKLYFMSERVGAVIRRGLFFFPPQALEPVIQPLMERMTSSFEATGYASFLWISGKVVSKFGDLTRGPGGEALAGLLLRTFESMTTQLSKLLNGKVAVEIPDVMEDFVHMFIAFITFLPHATLSSPLLHLALSHTLAALTCPAPETNLVCLDALAILSKRLSEPTFQSALQPVFAQYGKAIVSLLINGMVTDFVEDGLDQVQTVLAATVVCAPMQEVEGWVGEAVAAIPGHVVPMAEKQHFVEGVRRHLASPPGSPELKRAVNSLVRAAKRARERGREARQSIPTR